MSCSALQEQAAGSLPSTSQVSLHIFPVHACQSFEIGAGSERIARGTAMDVASDCRERQARATDQRSGGAHSLYTYVGEWMLPRRVCCPWPCAMPVQHLSVPEQAQDNNSPLKHSCDKQVSSWRHISCHTDKNRYYT